MLAPPPTGYMYCWRCLKLVKLEHLRDGYGPRCWPKITHGSRFIPWLKDKQPTIIDRKEAERSMLKIWRAIDTECPRKMEWLEDSPTDAILASYDHDDGFELPGFGARQWVFLHCPKCNYDRVMNEIPQALEMLTTTDLYEMLAEVLKQAK